MCKIINHEEEEYENQVILVCGKGTEKSWKVCVKCLDLARDFMLDNQEKNGN